MGKLSVLVLVGLLSAVSAQAQSTDDIKWVAQCIADNASATASQGMDVVSKYCGCMNNKMGNSETQSITQWEKSHTAERDACSAAAGWK